ncbi:MAG: hypothetical protein P8O03_09025, partial [Ilumatobacter sp.]|nr:hypothetical protein [Ilumatobacter sp.]
MKMRSAKLSIALTALTVATVGCSFSDDDGGSTADTGPETTLGTVPDPEATSTAPVPTEPAAADSGDDPDTTLPSTTTMLT